MAWSGKLVICVGSPPGALPGGLPFTSVCIQQCNCPLTVALTMCQHRLSGLRLLGTQGVFDEPADVGVRADHTHAAVFQLCDLQLGLSRRPQIQ